MIKENNIAKEWLSNADMLTEALPYMQKYAESVVVIKYGGNAMKDSESISAFCEDIALLKQSGLKPVIVHGGGPQIGNMLEKIGIETKFESGMRITDDKKLEIVEMVLCGGINKEIASKINNCGCKAIGLSGKDASMIIAKKHNGKIKDESNIEKIIDLGFVDSFRYINKKPDNYSWWSYRANSREKNKGWRIDYNFVKNNLVEKITNSYILNNVYHSDHCPVVLELN